MRRSAHNPDAHVLKCSETDGDVKTMLICAHKNFSGPWHRQFQCLWEVWKLDECHQNDLNLGFKDARRSWGYRTTWGTKYITFLAHRNDHSGQTIFVSSVTECPLNTQYNEVMWHMLHTAIVVACCSCTKSSRQLTVYSILDSWRTHICWSHMLTTSWLLSSPGYSQGDRGGDGDEGAHSLWWRNTKDVP